MKRRYTYSFANAYRYLPFYNELIEHYNNPTEGRVKPIKVPVNFLNPDEPVQVGTLQNQISDGLKWVAECFGEIPEGFVMKHPRQAYQILKLNLRVSCAGDGQSVTLTLKMTRTGESLQSLMHADDPGKVPTSTIFRTKVQAFLENKEKRVEMFDEKYLSPADKIWIDGILTNPFLSSYWSGGKLTIAKDTNG